MRELDGGETSQAKLSKSEVAIYSLKECTVHSTVCESLHLSLASVSSLWFGNIPSFLIASEGTRRERALLELVLLVV